MKKAVLILVLIGLAVSIYAYRIHQLSQQAVYTVTDLGTLSGDRSYAIDINNNGQIIGNSDIEWRDYVTHPFLWENGVMKDLGMMGYNRCYVSSINDNGLIIGTLSNDGRHWILEQGFVWQNGKVTILGSIDGHPLIPTSINSKGQIAGYIPISKIETQGFIWKDGKIIKLGIYKGRRCCLFHIDDNGKINKPMPKIAGSFRGDKGITRPLDINSEGIVIGWSQTSKPSPISKVIEGEWLSAYDIQPFIWKKGKIRNLNSLIPPYPRWRIDYVRAINDKGQIVGRGIHGKKTHAILLTPVRPLPD